MIAKPIIRRALARVDILNAADYYFHEGGQALELRFIDAIEAALLHIAAFPASGSSRHAELGQGQDLRFWQTRHFPYLIFYIEHEKTVDVWRVLHGERDLPAWF